MAFGSLIPLLSNRASMCSARGARHVRPGAAGRRPAGHARNLELVLAAAEANMSNISRNRVPQRRPPLHAATLHTRS